MLVWDLPLRLFHWGLVVAVAGAIAASKADVMWLHERFGLTVMGLVGFRIIWGFIGGHYARFRQFLTPPRVAIGAFLRLLKPDTTPSVGHSAAAGYAVIGLLAITGFLATTGTLSNDDVLFEGPLAHVLPTWSDAATRLHDAAEPFLFAMIILHLAALLLYKFVKKRNLTMTMLNGHADDAATVRDAEHGAISPARNVFGVLLLIGFVLAANSLSLLRPAFY